MLSATWKQIRRNSKNNQLRSSGSIKKTRLNKNTHVSRSVRLCQLRARGKRMYTLVCSNCLTIPLIRVLSLRRSRSTTGPQLNIFFKKSWLLLHRANPTSQQQIFLICFHQGTTFCFDMTLFTSV